MFVYILFILRWKHFKLSRICETGFESCELQRSKDIKHERHINYKVNQSLNPQREHQLNCGELGVLIMSQFLIHDQNLVLLIYCVPKKSLSN